MHVDNPICPECDLPFYCCACEQRVTTVHGRYHVGHPDEGLIAAVARKAEAFTTLADWHNNTDWLNPDDATVYDSMARRGAAQLWGYWNGRVMALAYRVRDDLEKEVGDG
jgi:hypothetical protein